MLAVARTFALIGIDAEPVHVELDIGGGLPSFTIVGLPDAAVRESRERVRAALVNSGFEFPLRRITANLAPADLPKAGPGFDLAIAAALLVASNQIPHGLLERHALAGELALDGSIRPVPGALAMAEGTRGLGLRGIAVAPGDAPQAALVKGVEVVALEHIARLRQLAEGAIAPVPPTAPESLLPDGGGAADLADLKGQPALRSALEVVAAGGHGVLMVGPPGVGKTLAARRLPSLLPPLATEELLEVARIAGACGDTVAPTAERPFRAPHHTVSGRALTGGGTPPRPGEVTRAHRGRPLPRRARGVSPRRARGAAAAARGGTGDDLAGGRRGHAPLPVHAGGRLQPLPLRARGGLGRMRVPPRRGRALPREAERRPRRPDRRLRRPRAARGRAAGGGPRARPRPPFTSASARRGCVSSGGSARAAATRR